MEKEKIQIDWTSDNQFDNDVSIVDIIKDLKKILEMINGVLKVRVLQNTDNKAKFKFEVLINNINKGNRLGTSPIGVAIFVNTLKKNTQPNQSHLWQEIIFPK